MVEIKIARVPGSLIGGQSNPQMIASLMDKGFTKDKLADDKLNMSDCLPAIEAMLQGIIIEFPAAMTLSI